MDYGAGKQGFFTKGIKALIESSTVFEKEAESEFFYLKKGANPSRQASSSALLFSTALKSTCHFLSLSFRRLLLGE